VSPLEHVEMLKDLVERHPDPWWQPHNQVILKVCEDVRVLQEELNLYCPTGTHSGEWCYAEFNETYQQYRERAEREELVAFGFHGWRISTESMARALKQKDEG
jgi:hypothetical protein